MRIVLILFSVFLFGACNTQQEIKTLTNDGAWCWFSNPRAIYTHSNPNEIITGWVSSDGSIVSSTLNLKTDASKKQVLASKLDKDDHANPSFCELTNGNILSSYTKHMDKYVRFHIKNNAGIFSEANLFTPLNDEQFEKFPRKCVTYANPFQLKEENDRIYCFGRWTGFKPNLTWSNDDGQTWSPAKVYITNYPFSGGNRPYVNYYSDGESRIHIVFTDGHPRNEPLNSVYYTYYEDGAFWRIDGTQICTIDKIPFEPKDASLVYKATKETGRAWVYDITADEKGKPIILYARYPEENQHIYHYTSYEDKSWIDNTICNSGKWFPQTLPNKIEKEPHYSAGMTLHPIKTNTVYLSRNIDGVFEIERWKTQDKGETWESKAITEHSVFDNVRPIVPKNMQKGDKTVILWMENEKYIHYTNYKSSIKYKIDN